MMKSTCVESMIPNNYESFVDGVKSGKILVQKIKGEDYRSKNIITRGYLVAVKTDDNDVLIGSSVCSKYDIFNKKLGILIAFNRALLGGSVKLPRFHKELQYESDSTCDNWITFKHTYKSTLDYFVDRCKKFFKVDEVIYDGSSSL